MPYFRDRILADPLFLFKVGAEVVIDSGAHGQGGAGAGSLTLPAALWHGLKWAISAAAGHRHTPDNVAVDAHFHLCGTYEAYEL